MSEDDGSIFRALATVSAGIVLLLVGGVAISLWLTREGGPSRGPSSFLVERTEPPPPAPAAASDGAAPETGAAPADAPQAAAARKAPGSREPIPRPRGLRASTGSAEGGGGEGPVDRRENPPPGSEALREALVASMDEMQPEIADCVEGWAEAGAVFDGELVLAFRLGPEGLQGAEVVDVEGVPGPVLTCFGTAVYEVDWPPVDEPLEVTRPYVVTSEDSG